MEELQKLIDEYVQWVQKNQKESRKVTLYLGLQVENHPNHAAFYEAVGEWVKSFASARTDDAGTAAVVRILLFSAAEHQGSQAEWYLIAIQNYAKDLIGELSAEEKAQLAQEYREKYPKGRRLPLQNEIDKLLRDGKKEPFWKWHIKQK